jgi:hypothetical protein
MSLRVVQLLQVAALIMAGWALFQEFARAAPGPPVDCDKSCREKQGPFIGNTGDDEGKCFQYLDNNCTVCDNKINMYYCEKSARVDPTYKCRDFESVILTTKQYITLEGGEPCNKYCTNTPANGWEARNNTGVMLGTPIFVNRQKCDVPQ